MHHYIIQERNEHGEWVKHKQSNPVIEGTEDRPILGYLDAKDAVAKASELQAVAPKSGEAPREYRVVHRVDREGRTLKASEE